jgi:hypothetical protein
MLLEFVPEIAIQYLKAIKSPVRMYELIATGDYNT